MRYAIFSDVHANRQAWEAVRADVVRLGIDTLVCLGDVVGYGPKPQEVLAAVREVTPDFVLGNHDAAACGRLDPAIFNPRARTVIEWTRERLDEESLAFLNQVPLRMDGEGVLFVHAEVMEPGEFGYVDGPGPAQLNMRAMTQPIAFIGHTHLPMAFTMPKRGGQVTQLPPTDFEVERGKRTLVNVGSVGEPRTTDVRASYVIYDDVERTVTFRKVVFDVEGYKADLLETGLDISPYFVQVVDAGKVAGAPVPTAAPQLALAQLPKVAEVVAGHAGHLVLGRPAAGAAWGSGAPAPMPLPSMQKARSVPVAAIVAAVLLVAVCVGAIVLKATRKDELAVQPPEIGAEKQSEAARRAGTPAGSALASPSRGTDQEEEDPAGSTVPMKALKAKVYASAFADLGKLREADSKEKPTKEHPLPDGLFDLEVTSGQAACGVVWEGNLVVPESGDYEFTLDSDQGAALFLYWDKEVELAGPGQAGQATKKVVKMRKGHAPIRLEYIQKESGQELVVTWSGPGIDGVASLVGGGSARPAPDLAKNDPTAPEPDADPAPPRQELQSAAKLSENLVAYWSFDDPEAREARIKVDPQTGTAVEKLVAASGQRVQVLVPKEDPGSRWTELSYDAKEWKVGQNGVGYSERPGPTKDLIKNDIGNVSKKQPHTVFVRIPFEVEDPSVYTGLALMMKFDDGFVAYLNGNSLASSNAPDKLAWNAAAKKPNANPKVDEFETFKVSSRLKYLTKGWNILAIQGFNGSGEPNATNTGSTSSDMLILPELLAQRKDAGNIEPPAPPSKEDVAVQKEQKKGAIELVPGKFGDAFQFADGKSIEIGTKDSYAIGEGSFSVSLWFTRDPGSEDNQARRLVSAGAGGAAKAGWALRLSKKMDALTFSISDGKTSSDVTASEQSLGDGEWRHVVVTVDRPSQMVFLFLNGKLVADQRCQVLGATELPSGSGLSLGRNSDGEQNHRGKLDDVAIWKRALAPVEVEKIFESRRDDQALGAILGGKVE